MAGCATITTSSGYGLPTTIPPNQMDYIYAQAGTTIALYTTLIYPGGFLQYSNFNPIDFSFGVVTGDVIIDNGHMALLVGAGKTYRFGSGTFMDRVWNGGIRYMLGVQNRIDGQIPDNGCRISAEPSLIPSLHPTMSFAPSLSPTFSGNSKSPSSRPSMYPSSKPTFRPTKRPTQHPTKTVSMKPSYKPSVMESSGPTKFKSSYPSLYPTVAKLTLEPSIKTSLPTIDITMSLSWVPIGPPVLLTSLGPTKVGATSLPSIEPSFINNVVRPSEAPSVSNYPSILNSYPLPSLNPSRSPITQSSLIPSVVPSFVRSGIPSEIPSEISLLISAVDETVTGTPSDVPSATLSTSSTGTALLAAVAAAGMHYLTLFDSTSFSISYLNMLMFLFKGLVLHQLVLLRPGSNSMTLPIISIQLNLLKEVIKLIRIKLILYMKATENTKTLTTILIRKGVVGPEGN